MANGAAQHGVPQQVAVGRNQATPPPPAMFSVDFFLAVLWMVIYLAIMAVNVFFALAIWSKRISPDAPEVRLLPWYEVLGYRFFPALILAGGNFILRAWSDFNLSSVATRLRRAFPDRDPSDPLYNPRYEWRYAMEVTACILSWTGIMNIGVALIGCIIVICGDLTNYFVGAMLMASNGLLRPWVPILTLCGWIAQFVVIILVLIPTVRPNPLARESWLSYWRDLVDHVINRLPMKDPNSGERIVKQNEINDVISMFSGNADAPGFKSSLNAKWMLPYWMFVGVTIITPVVQVLMGTLFP